MNGLGHVCGARGSEDPGRLISTIHLQRPQLENWVAFLSTWRLTLSTLGTRRLGIFILACVYCYMPLLYSRVSVESRAFQFGLASRPDTAGSEAWQ